MKTRQLFEGYEDQGNFSDRVLNDFMNTHQQQIDKKLKNSRTMLNLNNSMSSQQKKPQLESLELGALFMYTKSLMKKWTNTSSDDSCFFSSKSQIQGVLQFIVQKIESKSKMPMDRFVALISIFVYVNVMGQCKLFVIKYNQEFYNNLGSYFQSVLDAWANNQDISQKGNSKTNLSILLCSLSSLVEENSKNTIDIDIKKVFSPALLKSLLSVKLPNEQKIMRHYRNLIVYIGKQQIPKFVKKSYVWSLGYHLMSCPASKNMQISAVFLLNKFIEDNKLVNRIGEIWTQNELIQLVSSCLQIVLTSTQPMQLKLVLQFCCKLTSKLPILPEYIVDAHHFMKLYKQIYKNVNSDKLCPCLQQILLKISTASCWAIFKEISEEDVHSTVQLQILENCTKKLTQGYLIEIIQSGKWEKLLIEVQAGSSYKKYLLNKIITNIITCSHENADLHFILKNLYAHSSPFQEWKPIN